MPRLLLLLPANALQPCLLCCPTDVCGQLEGPPGRRAARTLCWACLLLVLRVGCC